MFGLGMPELMVIFVVVLLIFGPGKLPSLGKSVGEAIRGFKKGMEEEPVIEAGKDKKIENQKV